MLTEEALRGASREVQQFLVESVPEEETPHQFSEDFEKKIKRAIRWKRIRKWIPAILVVTVTLALVICAQFTVPNTLWIEPLSEADMQHLSDAVREPCDYKGWIEWNDYHEYDNPYYGTINRCTVVRVEYPIELGILNWGYYEAAGYTFYWIDKPELYAYRDGEVCRLDEAYERGWLTKEQIGVIYEQHEAYISMLPEEYQAEFRAWIEKMENKKKNG